MVLSARHLVAAVALLLGGTGVHAQAPTVQPRAVIELFTSQGCSSCPPADALFIELAKDPGVIALTLPVTYWDYLGWRDTLGQDTFTKRQKHYAKARGDGQVYTPQAVVNGAGHIVGTDRGGIEKLVGEQAKAGFPVAVALAEKGDDLQIALKPALAAAATPAGIWLLPVSRLATVPIERGENTGKTVTYANVVRGMTRIGDWQGTEATITVPLATARTAGADGYVVLVQADQPARGGIVLGAARGGKR